MLSMMRPRRSSGVAAAAFLAAAIGLVPVLVHADAPDPEAARIAAAGHSLKWNWTLPGRAPRYGHAETLIHAPLDIVRAHVLDYAHYREIEPDRFTSSRVIGHEPDHSTDVYIQIAVLHGVVSLWDVARFSPPRRIAPGLEEIEGRMVPGKGNVDDMDCVWTLHALGDDWTVLKFDLFLAPGLPAPQWAVDEELRDSAESAVDSMHDRSQGSRDMAKWPG